MEIHHYTRAATIPLILQSGKIRFTRADYLDDESEMPFKTAHVDARNYFVSSWTTVRSEHSGQWYRYGDQHRGTRVTLPIAPFEFRRVSWEISRNFLTSSLATSKVGIKLTDVNMPFSIAEMLGDGYVLSPYSHNLTKDFGGPVEYVVDPVLHVAELLAGDDHKTIIHNAGKLGRIKSDAWADQAEYRFVLMAQEGPGQNRLICPESYDNALLDLYERKMAAGSGIGAAQVKFIDLPLAEGIFNRMTITLGCNISDDDREAVRRAVHLHAPEARIVESSMTVRTG